MLSCGTENLLKPNQKPNRSGMLSQRSRWAQSAPIVLGRRHGGVGRPVPFSAAVRFPVKDQYPLGLGEPKHGRPVWGANPLPSALWPDALPHELPVLQEQNGTISNS